jgi:hypothetical protein
LDPRDGDLLDGIVKIVAEVSDIDDNVHSVWFHYSNASGNWSLVNDTRKGTFVYISYFDTNKLVNGTYFIKVTAEDRNLYMEEEVITVTVLHD